MKAARRRRNQRGDADARRGATETRRKAIFTEEAPRRRGKPKRTAPLRWNAARLPCGFEGAENNWLIETSSRLATTRPGRFSSRSLVNGVSVFGTWAGGPALVRRRCLRPGISSHRGLLARRRGRLR